MLCPFCNSEIEDLAKRACNKCASAAAAEPVITYEVPEPRAANSFPASSLAGLCIAAVVLSIGVWNWSRSPGPVFHEEGGQLVLSDAGAALKVSFDFGEEELIEGNAVFLNKVPDRGNLIGFSYALAYITKEEYATMKRDYIDAGRCTASFLNTHAKTLALIVDREDMQRELAVMKLTEGTPIQVQGQSLTPSHIDYKGMPATFSLNKGFRIFRPANIRLLN